MTFTANKMTRISKISTIYKFPNTFKAVFDACEKEGLINSTMTAKTVSKIIDARYADDAQKQTDQEYNTTTETVDQSTYTETAFTRAGKAPWVAVITGKDEKFGFKRDFVDASKTGDKFTWVLTAGVIYEAFEKVSNKNEYRGFFKIENGKKVKMTKEEVAQSL